MAAPQLIACPEGQWTLVASSVKLGNVWVVDSKALYFQTYRDSGLPAPTTDAEAVLIPRPGAKIESAVDIDVYVWAKNADGLVRVDSV